MEYQCYEPNIKLSHQFYPANLDTLSTHANSSQMHHMYPAKHIVVLCSGDSTEIHKRGATLKSGSVSITSNDTYCFYSSCHLVYKNVNLTMVDELFLVYSDTGEPIEIMSVYYDVYSPDFVSAGNGLTWNITEAVPQKTKIGKILIPRHVSRFTTVFKPNGNRYKFAIGSSRNNLVCMDNMQLAAYRVLKYSMGEPCEFDIGSDFVVPSDYTTEICVVTDCINVDACYLYRYTIDKKYAKPANLLKLFKSVDFHLEVYLTSAAPNAAVAT